MRFAIILIFCSIFVFGLDLKIATYNVENLFDDKNNGNEYKEFRIENKKWGKYKSKKKLERIREVVLSIDADIIALQEVENESILRELIKDTPYKFISFSTRKNAPVGLGLISKIQPKASKSFEVSGVKTRDILRVDFELKEGEFSLFVVHFPAYKNGLKAQKMAEKTLRVALGEHKNVIVLGDFNIGYGKNSLLKDIIATKNYKNLWDYVPKYKDRYSYARKGSNKRAIDHVLLSKEFLGKDGNFGYVCKSFHVFKPDFMATKNGYTKSDDKDSFYSDHFPLVFEISTDKKRVCGIIYKFLNLVSV